MPLDTFSVKAEKKRQKERMVRLYTLRSFLCIINHIDTMTCDCDIKSIFFHKCLFKSMLQAEIEKVKKRREERAIEKAQHEEEMVEFGFLKSMIVTYCKNKLSLSFLGLLTVLFL